MSGKAYVVLRDSPAAKVLKSKASKGFRPGGIVEMTPGELESWRNDVEVVEVPDVGHMPRRRRELKLPPNVPRNVQHAAIIVTSWIDENDIKDWMIDGLTSVKP